MNGPDEDAALWGQPHSERFQDLAAMARKVEGKEMTHTPGPWGYGSTGNICSVYPVTAKGTPLNRGDTEDVCQISKMTEYDWKANARLIAAAPDLLAALVEVTDRFEAAPGAVYATDSDRLVIKQARAAMAKAEGRQ